MWPPWIRPLVICLPRHYIALDSGRAEDRFRLSKAGGGKSEHQRARCRVTSPRRQASRRRYTRAAGASLPTDSATENIPPGPQGPGKGEKARQELTACRATGKARKTPSGARPNRKPRSGPLQVPPRGTGFGYRPLRQMILSPDFSGQTEFGLQPGRNQSPGPPINPIFFRRVSKSESTPATRKRSSSENFRPNSCAFMGFR